MPNKLCNEETVCLRIRCREFLRNITKIRYNYYIFNSFNFSSKIYTKLVQENVCWFEDFE